MQPAARSSRSPKPPAAAANALAAAATVAGRSSCAAPHRPPAMRRRAATVLLGALSSRLTSHSSASTSARLFSAGRMAGAPRPPGAAGAAGGSGASASSPSSDAAKAAQQAAVNARREAAEARRRAEGRAGRTPTPGGGGARAAAAAAAAAVTAASGGGGALSPADAAALRRAHQAAARAAATRRAGPGARRDAIVSDLLATQADALAARSAAAAAAEAAAAAARARAAALAARPSAAPPAPAPGAAALAAAASAVPVAPQGTSAALAANLLELEGRFRGEAGGSGGGEASRSSSASASSSSSDEDGGLLGAAAGAGAGADEPAAPATPPPEEAPPKRRKSRKAAEAEGAAAAETGEAAAAAAAAAAAPTGLHAEPAGDPPPPYVHVVTTAADARRVAALLMSPAMDGRLFACDTEVAAIDVARESPCGHGRVICFSLYAGPDVDFRDPAALGAGTPPPAPQPQLFVDTLLDGTPASAGEAAAIMAAFAPFWAAPHRRKVWHNYSFDRHVLENAGLALAGFDGDTMHMARLWDSSRARGKGYSLESLSNDADLMGGGGGGGGSGGGSGRAPPAAAGRAAAAGAPAAAAAAAATSPDDSVTRSKTSMKDLFGRPNLKKDGTPGKLVTVPPVQDLQTAAATRGTWVKYAALDAQATWDLRAALEARLRATAVSPDAALAAGGVAVGRPGFSAWDLYETYWRPFGELLTDMEAAGVRVDRAHLAAAQVRAEADREAARARFRGWAASLVPDAAHMNVNSGPQVRTLLFAGTPDGRPGGEAHEPLARRFKVPNEAGVVEPGRKAPRKHLELELHGLWGPGVASPLLPAVHTATGRAAVSTPVLRALAGAPGAALRALADRGLGLADDAPPPEPAALADTIFLDDAGAGGGEEEEDEGGGGGGGRGRFIGDDGAGSDEEAVAAAHAAGAANAPAGGARADAAALEAEAKALGVGTLFAAFGGGTPGLRACAAVDALCEVGAIDTLLSNFIIPLQGPAIATPEDRFAGLAAGAVCLPPLTPAAPAGPAPAPAPAGPPPALGRVHCSLNINTETGRLSARRPNLQNQPALEKDRYRVRRAFTADTAAGRTLIVADYGQLELRLLAHMANCPSMLAAFEAGGDFHSRTALGMYDHIRRAVEAGEVALEREEGGAGDAPADVPLLKDVFASERRRAKVLNFSIAYGKTAHGLARDWGTTVDEAAATVERWYADRPEVQAWQEATRAEARRAGRVRTLLGRTRVLPDALVGRNGRPRAGARAYQHALRAAINSPIQGSAADVATAAMLAIAACPRLAALGWRLLLQVHDEVILEGPAGCVDEAQALVVHHMEHPFEGTNPLRVALAVDAKHADNWYDAK